MGVISLSKVESMIVDLCPDFISFTSTEFVLTEWVNKGVVSEIEIRDKVALYPEIIVIEILTVLNLKKEYNYSLLKIAKAKKFLNLSLENMDCTEAPNLLNFINLKRIHNDKKVVIKKAIQKMNSIEAIKNIIDELNEENKKLKMMADYSLEFFKAKKEVQKINPKFIN